MRSIGQQYELNIGELKIKDIRCRFDVDSGFSRQVKKGVFVLSNLSEESYNLIQKDLPVSFFLIGDNESRKQIFQGTAINKSRVFSKDSSVETTVNAWSGSLSTRGKSLSITFSGNTTGIQILHRLRAEIKPLDLTISETAQKKASDLRYPGGVSFSGNISDVLRDFAEELLEPFTLDDSVFHIGQIFNDKHYISASIGNLIGTPSVNIGRTDVTAALMPEIKIGDKVNIESKYFSYSSSESTIVNQRNRTGNGNYSVWNLIHSGDTHGKKWITKLALMVTDNE